MNDRSFYWPFREWYCLPSRIKATKVDLKSSCPLREKQLTTIQTNIYILIKHFINEKSSDQINDRSFMRSGRDSNPRPPA